MRSSSSLLLLVAVAGCSGSGSGEQREHEELECALVAFSEAAPEERELRLEEVRRLDLTSTRVREVRQTCLAAYEAFFSAMARLEDVKDRAAEVEAESTRVRTGVPAEGDRLFRMQEAALDGTRAVTEALDRAETLVDECSRCRAALAVDLAE